MGLTMPDAKPAWEPTAKAEDKALSTNFSRGNGQGITSSCMYTV